MKTIKKMEGVLFKFKIMFGLVGGMSISMKIFKNLHYKEKLIYVQTFVIFEPLVLYS